MLDKSRGAVGCGHCQGLGARETCPLCGRPVCDRCLTPDACPRPGPRVIKLGLGRRLRAVDHSGRLGLVTSWFGRGQVLDLYTGATLVKRLPARVRWPYPCLLTPDLMVKVPSQSTEIAPGKLFFVRLGQPGVEGPPAATELQTGASPIVALELSADGRLLMVKGADETLALVDPEQRRVSVTLELPRQVIHAAATCQEMDLAALGSYGRVGLYRISDGQVLGHVRLDQGDVVWLGLAGGRLVAINEHARLVVLEVQPGREPARWERSLELRLDSDAVRHVTAGEELAGLDTPRVRCSLSGDGELLAMRWRRGRELATFRLPRGLIQVFAGHDGPVNQVRFVGQGRMLLTAGADARVIFWPRVGQRLVSRSG